MIAFLCAAIATSPLPLLAQPLRLSSLLVEFRRNAFRFWDKRGQLCEALIADYGTLKFLGVSPGSPDRIGADLGIPQRNGWVAYDQATFEDSSPSDVLEAASKGMVFLRRAERLLEVKSYDRIGLRMQFLSVAPGALSSVARATVGINDRPSWELENFAIGFRALDTDWDATLTLSPRVSLSDAGPRFEGELLIDIDQWRLNVPYPEAIAIDLGQLIDRGRTLANVFAARLSTEGVQ